MNILGFLVGFVLIVIGIWAFFKALTGLLKFLMGAVILAMIALIVYNELQSNNIDTTGLLQTVTHKWTEIEGVFEKHFDKEQAVRAPASEPINNDAIVNMIKSIQTLAHQNESEPLFKNMPDSVRISKNIASFYPVIQEDGFVASQGESIGKYLVYFDSQKLEHFLCLRMGSDTGLYSTRQLSQVNYSNSKPARFDIIGIFNYVGECDTKFVILTE